ncbi:hypothetical protein BC628DRAFT_1388956 [Trametes gibbosa]|nr:hypothetical protein BC628DRAFT_1388956 [Trametes gibbosa]
MSSPTDSMRLATPLQRILTGLSPVELVHTSHPRWPLPPQSSTALAPSLHISVLDSSFNPPTLAHLALANTPPPPTAEVPPHRVPHDFDARLLLLSVRNADKQLKPGDATYEQRVEMIVLLAHTLAHTVPAPGPTTQTHARPRPSSPDPTPADPRANVAVALIDAPTFVRKSSLLHAFLAARLAALLPPPPPPAPPPAAGHAAHPPQRPAPKLTFLMGTDTVARLFAPRYYPDAPAMRAALRRFLAPAPDGEDSRVVCARRAHPQVEAGDEERVEAEIAAFARTIVPFERLAFVDIGEREAAFSSSQVRALRGRGDERWRDMVPPSVAEYVVNNDLYVAS